VDLPVHACFSNFQSGGLLVEMRMMVMMMVVVMVMTIILRLRRIGNCEAEDES
jgi:hypothetical protein